MSNVFSLFDAKQKLAFDLRKSLAHTKQVMSIDQIGEWHDNWCNCVRDNEFMDEVTANTCNCSASEGTK